MAGFHIVFFLPLLNVMMTSGLPPREFALNHYSVDVEKERNKGSETINDWKETLTTAWRKLTFSNESLELVALNEGEHFNATEDVDQVSNHNSVSDRSTETNNNVNVTSATPSNSKDNDKDVSNENINKTDEMPPMSAPLHQNYTKVPLRGACNNISHLCMGDFVECRLGVCSCREGFGLRPDDRERCDERVEYNMELPQTDPTMIGVIVGLILMSVTLCVVLRLFAKARFRENRTIFNTPNPRLMNVSLMKGSKQLLRGNSGNASRSRRGSQVSLQSTTDVPVPAPAPISPKTENGIIKNNGKFEESTPRPKVSRQISTEIGGSVGTPDLVRPSSGGVNRYKYRQDSVASNV